MFNKSFQVYYVTFVSEAYFVQDDDVVWWVDSGAIVHVCKDRSWFKTYESLNDGPILHMGNESTPLSIDQVLGFLMEQLNGHWLVHVVLKRSLEVGTRDEVSDQHSNCFIVEGDSKTFDEAMNSQDIDFWKEAINDKMDSIIGNNTWVLADLPPRCKPLGCEWIFKRKLKMDVKKSFLNDELDEEVYMNHLKASSCPTMKTRLYPMDTVRSCMPIILAGLGKLRRYTSNPDTQHCQAIQQMLCCATLAKAYSQMHNRKSRHLGIRHRMIHELITNGVISIEFVRGLKHIYLQIIPRMCLEPAEKEDDVVNFLMVNVFEKVLSENMNKEEPPMYSNGLKGSILRTP
ncbi:hypothetical protein Tco_1127893 [Tanacetum coccineum]